MVPILAALLALQQPVSLPKHGIWGAKTVALDRAYPTGTVAVASPDGRSIAEASVDEGKETSSIRISGSVGRASISAAYGPNEEMMWSPDSRALFVTADDGGAIGTYELTVIGRSGGRVITRDLSRWLRGRFGRPVRCFEPEPWNVAGVAWLDGSSRLLAAVQILPHSNCDSMGTYVVYEVDPWRRRVLARFNQVEAKRRFRNLLGPRLLGDDQCVIRPSARWIPQLHPKRATGRRPPARPPG